MARPIKRTVDYFPHYVNHGKTLLILQNEYGNDGYAFWFKLLSLLCKTDGQVYDYNNPASWRLLLAETSVSEDNANTMLQLLADIDAIDRDLYKLKVIWVQNLIENLQDVYNRRTNGSTPTKPVIVDGNVTYAGVSVNKNTQTKLDYTKLDYTKLFDRFWNEYPKKRSKGQAEKTFNKLDIDEELLSVILRAIKKAKGTQQWQRDGGQYIPYPSTWLNAKGWEDEYKTGEGVATHKRNTEKLPTEHPDPEELYHD